MQRDVAGLAVVRDLYPKSKQIAQLPLKGADVGVDAARKAGACSPNVVTRARPNLFSERLGLPYGQALLDDLARKPVRIFAGGDGARVAHSDIASR